MKDSPSATPRELLLQRHAEAQNRLDALRRAAVPTESMTWLEFVTELFRPTRRVWAGLAMIWVLLAVLHLAASRAATKPLSPAPSSEAIASWLQQLHSHETLAQIDRAR